VWLRRWIFRIGHAVLRPYWLVVRPRVRGVKCVICREGDVLLVRHTYGARRRWELPGGAVKRWEEPPEAARREAAEELGIDIEHWASLGALPARLHRRRDTLFCFAVCVGDLDLDIDPGEIAEARWFPRNRLPSPVGRYVRRIVALAASPVPG
jgi:8-oxo-dGTP pyrophosphatase MutT (NUDIX family)